MIKRFFLTILLLFGLFINYSPAQPRELIERESALVAKRAEEIVGWLPSKAQALLPSIDDRQTWDKIAQMGKISGLPREMEKAIGAKLPELTEELYLEYSVNGNRTRCQNVMGKRHYRIYNFLLAECIENKGRFLPEIERLLNEYCSEKSWVLPAHDSGNKTYYDQETTVDLASSAFSWDLAATARILDSRLSDPVRKRVAENLEKRCFLPFEKSVKTGSPRLWWIRGRNNWNAVCLAGVTGAAQAAIDDPVRRAWYAAAGEHFSSYSMQGFTSDGYCSEGLGYWSYGFGNYVELSEILRRATCGKIDLMANDFAELVSRFPLRIRTMGNICAAFADCGARVQPPQGLTTFLAGYYGWTIPQFNDFDQFTRSPMYNPNKLGIYSLHPDFVPSKELIGTPIRDYFDVAGILVCRPCANPVAFSDQDKDYNKLAAGMKAGHNNELHNHNDVGSYTISYRNEPILFDVGGEVYTQRTFSKNRYVSKVINSWGHPVPMIDGVLQSTGAQARGTVTKTEFSEEKDLFAMDFKACYAVKGLESLTRTFVYNRADNSLTITDEFQFAAGVEKTFNDALTTIWDAQRDGSRILVGPQGKRLAAEITVETKTAEGTAKSIDWNYTSELCNEDQGSQVGAKRLGIVLPPLNNGKVTITVRPE